MRYFAYIFLVLMVLSACAPGEPVVQGLDSSWEFTDADGTYRGTAEVPGVIHTDLLAGGLISDPFYADNEDKLQWIGKKEWIYSSSFIPDPGIFEKQHIEIVFEGLDTYAEVYINDSLVLNADNMFRTWRVDIKDLLHEGNNKLRVRFLPPEKTNQEKAAKLAYRLPDDRAFTRKSPYQFGWDWGPVFVTCGIWKPVYLQGWDELRIESIHVHHNAIDEDPLPVEVQLRIESGTEGKARVRLFDSGAGLMLESFRIQLRKGSHLYTVQTILDDPELWWPAGLGEQKMYEWQAEVVGNGSRDEISTRFGVREINLVQEPDEAGRSFYFSVNGLPVFIKGANYVPQDNFLPRVDTARYEALIASVKAANMNMLRVWGGGFYENDIFYKLCDENGILVWQDFMFACNMYPGDDAFVNTVRQEAIDNVIRLSNHPSIALWCGNNEVDEGWHNWGWQKALGYSPEDSAKIWGDYLKLFEELLPAVVELYDPGTAYHPSSPMTGWGREEAYRQGDVHYWGVWWGEEPFEKYQDKVGRFVSEYGFQGMPPMETIESFGGLMKIPASRLPHPDPRILESHQKHPRGTKLIHDYMERDFIVPESFDDYVYISQVLQAEGMGKAFYAHRVSQPYCMGTLYWQLNDCWPVTSWSGLDYHGNWKALHYHVRRAYAPVMVYSMEIDSAVYIIAVNDHPEGRSLTLSCSLEDLNGNVVRRHTEALELMPQSSRVIHVMKDLPTKRDDKVVVANLADGDSLYSESCLYFVPTRELKLPDPGLTFEVEENGSGCLVRIRAENLARQVFLEAPGMKGRFEDNFFDLAAGQTRWVRFLGEADRETLTKKIKVRSIYDTYH